MRSKMQAWFPLFHFQNGGRRIKIKHVIVMAVMPLSSLREFYNSGKNNLLSFNEAWQPLAKTSNLKQ